VTFGRLAVAWIVVAAWFLVATIATNYVTARLALPPEASVYRGIPPHIFRQRLIEAFFLTLIASLWFDSLGSGQWWLLFLLIGGLVASPTGFGQAPNRAIRRALLAGAVAELGRYLIAGGLLAWRLS